MKTELKAFSGRAPLFSALKMPTVMAFAFAVLTSAQATAASVGSDCKPAGLWAVAKEAFDAESFWSEQIVELQTAAEKARWSYKAATLDLAYRRTTRQLERERDEQKRQLAGVDFSRDPELTRLQAEAAQVLEESYADLRRLDAELLSTTEAWVERCTAYAQQRLNEAGGYASKPAWQSAPLVETETGH
jgi:hypothetical protein